MRILLTEDDPTLREFLVRGLQEAGYAVDGFANGMDALVATESVAYDVVVLDVNLPGLDGFEICRRIRARPDRGPAVLFLTARDAIEDRVNGLDLGAGDYLVKPFAFAELLARIRVLLRRGTDSAPVLQVADLTLDPAMRRVRRDGADVKLTAREFALLEYLMRNAGRVVTKPMIAEHVWNFDLEAESNFIEVYIYAIRKKLDVSGAPPLIQTVRGVGYRLDADVSP
jgi:two-component system copper resistance phosphate regulon response regulator CusR